MPDENRIDETTELIRVRNECGCRCDHCELRSPDRVFLSVVQWTISELACYTYSLVAVPLYDTLGTEAIGYIINKGTLRHRFRPRAHGTVETLMICVRLCVSQLPSLQSSVMYPIRLG